MIPGIAGKGRFGRLWMWLGLGLLVVVALAGVVHSPGAANAGELFQATPAPNAPAATESTFGQTWGGGGLGIDLVDLTWKGLLVLALLFVTLRVLARVQGAGQPRRGNLNVLESRTLAPKASLHLVAVGERRLVVGLTPGGMVALAELDADELPETVDQPGLDAAGAAHPVHPAPGTTDAAGIGGAAAAATRTPTAPATRLESLTRPLVAPVDSFADKLAAMMRGGTGR